jgi:molecular chaperone GrpE
MSSEQNPAGTPAESVSSASTDAAGETITAEQLQEWRTAQERYIRLYADFENFKKRAQRERDEARRSAVESVVTRLLPVMDTFEMALAATHQPGVSLDSLRTGVNMIHGQFRGVFSDLGLEEIQAVGQPFDPSLHEAVSQQETSEVPEGQVVQQLRKGYRNRDRLLRAASVVVARPPAPTVSGDQSAGSTSA